MNILIIEDEILIQQSLKKLFERKGHKVETTSSGKEAITKIYQFNFDRIICDLMLNDINGFDIIEDCKKKYKSNEISTKFVIITAYSSEGVLDKAKEYGCKLFQKPFDNIHEALDLMIKD